VKAYSHSLKLIIALTVAVNIYADNSLNEVVKFESFQLAKVVIDSEQGNILEGTSVKPEQAESTLQQTHQSMQLVPSQKKPSNGAVKITQESKANMLTGAPTLNIEKVKKEQAEPASSQLLGQKVYVKQKQKETLVEGYKYNRRGTGVTYVHGEITEDRNGDVSGYLYDKRGKSTYIYGNSNSAIGASSEDNGGIYVQDQKQDSYILKQDF